MDVYWIYIRAAQTDAIEPFCITNGHLLYTGISRAAYILFFLYQSF